MKDIGGWIEDCPFPIKACDKDANLVFINGKAAKNAEKLGGKSLVGKNILAFHKPQSQEKLKKLIAEGSCNVYSIEKKGKKSLVYQLPWIEGGKVCGMVEMTLPLPDDIPHYVRD